MMKSSVLAALAASFISSTCASGIYSKSSPVIQVDASNYDKVIKHSNYASIVEFYAPWCGHCQNLKPAYEKAAKSLQGLANVAAVNCDDESNKAFCGSMGVKGFPTLKIVRPSKKLGKPVVEDYQGARTAKAIVDAVVDKIPNNVKRVTDKTLEGWLLENNSTAKAILFSDKGSTSATLRALAIDYAGKIEIAQIRSKEEKSVELFGISSYPRFILLPGGHQDGLVYEGEMKKAAMFEFLSGVLPPNEDSANTGSKFKKSSASRNGAKSATASASFSAASKSRKPAHSESAKASATSQTIIEPVVPTESPDANTAKEDSESAVRLEDKPPKIPILDTAAAARKACFETKSHTCILVLLPATHLPDEVLPLPAREALLSLANIHQKHERLQTRLFPFYSIPATNELGEQLRRDLGLKAESDTEIIATNAKRLWWKHFSGQDYGIVAVEDWIDAIRMGDGKKEKIPDGLVKETKLVEPEKAAEAQPFKIEIEEILDDEVVDDSPSKKHDEL